MRISRLVLTWASAALLLAVLPMIFAQNAALSLLTQMGTMMLLCLSYNMLLGQGGMLSFGHTVYSGLGAFVAIHAMNRIGDGSLAIPMALIPLVGGVGGMAFGLLFGYITTRKAGTPFAMITLGMVELVSACVLMFPDVFGGEGGISANRTSGTPFFGITFGPQIEVYYLIAGWLWIGAGALYAFTQTPLGRVINAVRDNPERAAFIGYDPQMVRYLTLILSAFFAGMSGGLAAINFEIASAENVGALKAGAVLLFTFIGGTGYFFGPVIGAILGVLFSALLSSYTKAWQFYLGVFFIAIVMFAPQGVAHVLATGVRAARSGGWRHLWKPWCWALLATALALLGGVMLVEMLYQRSLGAAGESARAFGMVLDVHAWAAWAAATAALLAGALGLLRLRPQLLHAGMRARQAQLRNGEEAAP